MLFHHPDEVPNDLELHAILILGGGVPTSLEEPPLYVQRRCDDAVAVLRNRHNHNNNNNNNNKSPPSQQQPTSPSSNESNTPQDHHHHHHTIPLLCSSAGTAHLPQYMDSSSGLPIWEATSSAAYLLSQYCPHHEVIPQQLFVETTSYDTIGNAFFARTTHTDLHGWNKLLVITNEVGV